ncbi:MAG: hypothetical protein WC878_07190 [Candidatus Paceibacterota bacterium]|jgi:hypothetical protein
MIANTPQNQFASIEVLEELAKGEMGRFKKALSKASNSYFKAESKGLGPEEVKDLLQKITRAGSIITFVADDAYDTAFALLKNPDHERKSWDTHLTGARTLSRTAPKGYALSVAAKLLNLEETTDKVASLISRSTAVQSDIYRVVAGAKTFIDHYEWAKKQAERFGNDDDEMAVKYASLKTWERKEEFDQFSSVAEKATAGAIEVFIEGPVKLYLMISPEQLMIVIQGLVMRSAFDFANAEKKGLDDSLTLLLNSQKAVETSSLFKVVRELLAEGMKKYHSLWKEENEEIRHSFLDEDRAKRFVECFENGTLFARH